MSDTQDILISIRGTYVDSILLGSKRVELRTRAPKIRPRTRIWIYDTAPVALIRGFAILQSLETLPALQLWAAHQDSLGISFSDFQEYVGDRPQATALVLQNVQELREPLSLAETKEIQPGFHPPQFYMHLRPDAALLGHLEARLAATLRLSAAA